VWSVVYLAEAERELREVPVLEAVRRIGDVFVIAAVGPEAQRDRQGFDRAKRDAVLRLDEVED
jgi:hypothetical protein